MESSMVTYFTLTAKLSLAGITCRKQLFYRQITRRHTQEIFKIRWYLGNHIIKTSSTFVRTRRKTEWSHVPEKPDGVHAFNMSVDSVYRESPREQYPRLVHSGFSSLNKSQSGNVFNVRYQVLYPYKTSRMNLIHIMFLLLLLWLNFNFHHEHCFVFFEMIFQNEIYSIRSHISLYR